MVRGIGWGEVMLRAGWVRREREEGRGHCFYFGGKLAL